MLVIIQFACKNIEQCDVQTMFMHLYMSGFRGSCYVWTSKKLNCYDVGEFSRPSHFAVEEETWDDHATNIQASVDTYEYISNANVDVRQDVKLK